MSEKPKVLVVDDDKAICRLVDSILEMEGFPRRLAFNGNDARKAMAEEAFDILISDIYLGDASGLDLLELMKEKQPEAEVIIMTAQGSLETAVNAVRRGAFDYISKPFVVNTLLDVLRRIEEKRALTPTSTVGAELVETLPQTEIVGT